VPALAGQTNRQTDGRVKHVMRH